MAFVYAVALLTGCDQATPGSSAPLSQRGYLWQRAWSPAVVDAMDIAEERMDGVIILGAEILSIRKIPQVVRATIDWERLRVSKKPIAIALRIAPFPGPFGIDDMMAPAVASTAESLLNEAHSHDVKPTEFQLDFDCARNKLAGFRIWLRFLRPLIKPLRLVITALPVWLDEPEFKALLGEVDSYVLQVHSVPTLENNGRLVLCDTGLARKWVTKAAKLGVPFSVALPTYRCLAGYNPAGKLIGVVMDSVQPAWPRGTHILNFASDSSQIAVLVHEWLTAHPPELRELLWYRLPVADDVRNWRWTTLSALMAGRVPVHKLIAWQEGQNPIDLSISNCGEADEQGETTVIATWTDANLVASDALPGWSLRTENERVVFTRIAAMRSPLPPGAKRSIGWLHYDKATTVRLQVEELVETHR